MTGTGINVKMNAQWPLPSEMCGLEKLGVNCKHSVVDGPDITGSVCVSSLRNAWVGIVDWKVTHIKVGLIVTAVVESCVL